MDAPPIDHIKIIDGKACIISNGRRLKVKVIAAMVVKAGASIEKTMTYHELSRSELLAALAYYYDNQEAIEQSWRDADAYVHEHGISSERLIAKIRARQQEQSDN